MSIGDVEKLSARQMESMRRKQSREIDRLEEGHKELKTELKKAHESELVDIEHQNIKQLASESDKKEKVLNQMQLHLEETRKLTDKQIEGFKDQTAKVKSEESEKLSLERERVKSEHELYMEDMNYRFSEGHKEITAKNREKLDKLNDVKGAEIVDKKAYFDNKISHQTNEFTTRFTTDANKYKKFKDDQDGQFKKEKMSTNFRQQVDMGKMTSAHSESMEVRDQEFRKGLNEQNVTFEKKYLENLKARTDELGRLEKLNVKVEEKLKSDLQQKIEAKIIRSDDPFYQFTELKPRLKQFEDRVEISVEVPEYSKTDIQLTINNKDAIISYNRRYDDSRKSETAVNKLHKVESFTSKIATDHHLDAKSVKSSYADGVMTYVIKSA